MNESANSGLNPYMKPLDRGSLMSRPAPLAVHRPAAAEAVSQPEAAHAPAARRVTFFAREEAEKQALVPETPAEMPEQISFLEETSAKEPALTAPEESPVMEEAPQIPAAAEEEPLYAAFTPNEEPAPEEAPAFVSPVRIFDEIPAEEAAAEAPEKSTEAAASEELPPEPADDGAGEDPSYDYEAYYAAYWSQWQAAMEAQQNRACNVCPLMNQLQGKNASVCLVPVIVTDGQGQAQEPQAVLRMAGVQPAAEMPMAEEPTPAEPAFRAPVPDKTLDADELWSFGAPVAKVDDDDDYLGEDEMADEDMPVPQTIAPELPDLGLGKKKASFNWLWIPLIILLSLAALLVIAVILLSSTGHLQSILDKLNPPEIFITYLKNFGLL